MFSLHIDTARTWRGGQNQVLVTVWACARSGTGRCWSRIPAASCGSARRRGSTSFRSRRRTEMDLSAAWRLSRLIKQLKPDVIHAHDPHGVAMAALALSMSTQLAKPPLVASRRVDFHLKGNALSRWKYRQVDCFICASEAIRRDADRRRRARRRAPSRCTRASISSASTPRRRANLHEELWLPHHAPIVGNVAALVPHKGQRHLIEAAALVVRQVPDARFVIAGRRRAARPRSSGRSRSTTSRSTSSCSASGPTCCRCTRRSTSSS